MAEIISDPRKTRRGFRGGVLLRIVTVAAVLSLLIWAGLKVSAYREFTRDLTTYQSVGLGHSMDQIKYALGYPPFVLGPLTQDDKWEGSFQSVYQTDGKDPKNAMPEGKKVEDFLDWQYQETDHRIDLTFAAETKQISEIGCYVNSSVTGDTPQHCPPLFGIDSNSSEDDVLAALGPPDVEKFTGPSKSLRYDELGLEVTLSKRRVYMLTKTYPIGSSIGWFLSHRLL